MPAVPAPIVGLARLLADPETSRRNAIWVPSGDQEGSVSGAGSVVRRLAPGSPTIFSQISQLTPSSPAEAYAICVPSGEKLPLPANRSDESFTTVGGRSSARDKRQSVAAAAAARTRKPAGAHATTRCLVSVTGAMNR